MLWLGFNHVHPIYSLLFLACIKALGLLKFLIYIYCKYLTTLITIKLKNGEVGVSYVGSTVL